MHWIVFDLFFCCVTVKTIYSTAFPANKEVEGQYLYICKFYIDTTIKESNAKRVFEVSFDLQNIIEVPNKSSNDGAMVFRFS